MVGLSQGTLQALAATDVAEFESYDERFVRSVKDGCVSAVRGLSIERSRSVLEQELEVRTQRASRTGGNGDRRRSSDEHQVAGEIEISAITVKLIAAR